MTHKLFIGSIIAAAALLALSFSASGEATSTCAKAVLCAAPEVTTSLLSS